MSVVREDATDGSPVIFPGQTPVRRGWFVAEILGLQKISNLLVTAEVRVWGEISSLLPCSGREE